jgi:hypothetical protein
MSLFDNMPDYENGNRITAGWFSYIVGILQSVFSAGYIAETSFSGLASQTDEDVTGLVFDSTDVESAKVIYTIKTATKFEMGELNLIYDGSNWAAYVGALGGDDSGVLLDVNNSTGQVIYTSGAETFEMKFRASTFSA